MENKINKLEHRGLISGKIPILLNIEYEKYNPEKISTELILLSCDGKLVGEFNSILHGDDYGNLKIRGETDAGPEIIITCQGNNAKLFIDSFEYAISETPIENPENIYVTVELTPSGILKKWGFRELHYNGSIEFKNGYPEQIEWDLSIGKGTAFDTHMKNTMFMTTRQLFKLHDHL